MTGCSASNRCALRAPPPPRPLGKARTWTREESAFALLSYAPFSSQHLIWASVFLAISSSHTDHVAQGHRERERGRERGREEGERERGRQIWRRTQEETSTGRAPSHPPPPPPSSLLQVLCSLTSRSLLLTHAGPCCGFA